MINFIRRDIADRVLEQNISIIFRVAYLISNYKLYRGQMDQFIILTYDIVLPGYCVQ